MYILTALLCVLACSTATRQKYGLCSQVYLMSQYCSDNEVTPTADVTFAEGRVGKSGARGPPGERGLPGFVNYSIVDKKMEMKIKEIEDRFSAKFEEYKIVMNQTVLKLENKLEMLTTTGCHAVKRGKSKVKSGTGGIFYVYSGNTEMEVFCDLTTDGEKWTVFQRRLDGSQDFNQDWNTYVAGFGNLTGEFWLGLEKLHLLTQGGLYELRIEITGRNGNVGVAKYQKFSVAGSFDKYKLIIGEFSGAGLSDRFTYNNNMPFSTKDRDNDRWGLHCAEHLKGGWWFNSCHYANLNGIYGERRKVAADWWGIHWYDFQDIIKTEMKFRKI